MSLIDWKKMEAEVKYLYMLPLYTLLVAQNKQLMIGETHKLNIHILTNIHTYKHISSHADTHAHIHTHAHTFTHA